MSEGWKTGMDAELSFGEDLEALHGAAELNGKIPEHPGAFLS